MNIRNHVSMTCLFVTILLSSWAYAGDAIHVGLVTTQQALSHEQKSVLNWLNQAKAFEVTTMPFSELSATPDGSIDVYWFHIPDSSTYYDWMATNPELVKIKEAYENGGRLLLTNFASLLVHDCGIEDRRPEIRVEEIKDNWLFDKKGLQSWRGHPVFEGLFGGAFIWDTYEDHRLPRIGYFDEAFPENGRVVAVEKSYITVHRTRRLMVEYDNDKGRLLTIGGMVFFARENRLDFKMNMFIKNAIQYLSEKQRSNDRTYWQQYAYKPRAFELESNPVKTGRQGRLLNDLPQSGLLLEKEIGEDQFFDLAGRRALVMGKENGGIDELWMHPFRVLRDFETGIVLDENVLWLSALEPKIEVRPESFTRIYDTPEGVLHEIVYTDMNEPGAFLHYRAPDKKRMRLVIRFRSDLRWMWPYDEYALGDIWYGFDRGLNALHVRDETQSFYCLMGSDVPASVHHSGGLKSVEFDVHKNRFDGQSTNLNQVYHGAVYELSHDNDYCMNYLIVGTNEGRENAIEHYRRLLKNPKQTYGRTTSHYTELLNRTLIIESPDTAFNRLWKWGIVGADRFWAHTPPLGTALLAGFATTARGWNGGHEISGRPGYAWYFGRDAAWSGFAVDDYGDFEMVRQQLEFFQKYQSPSGKIFHELSTSGVVHYDASDATPLYVILTAHYLKASGDVEFLRVSWPYIRKAMDFMYSTDSDGDGLIENTNVGHGWVEGGKLWGVNTTFYLAGIWAQTLQDAAYMANLMDKKDLAEKYEADARQVQERLNDDFWNEEGAFFHYGKFADGTFNPEKTALPAVVMYYDQLDDAKVKPMLKTYAGNGFTTDWGVRILSSKSPLFKPTGYHYGSIWPLFTGWTALAEYQYGHSVQGFKHIMDNMRIKNYWALGFVEEVMHGAEYRPTGVCPHQCWSETNVLHPAITGMVGWKPDAPNKEATIKPRFPLHWDSVFVSNMRMGETVLNLSMTRGQNHTHYHLARLSGPPVTINLQPEIAEGMTIKSVNINGTENKVSTESARGLLRKPIGIELKEDLTVELNHTGGIGMIPKIPQPKPGASAVGYRIISSYIKGNAFFVELEGLSDSRGVFAVNIFDQTISEIEGAKMVRTDDRGILSFSVRFPESEETYVKKSIIIHLK